MRIIEITDSGTTDFRILIDLLHQQMIDIGSENSRSMIESAVRNALKPESRAVFFLAKKNGLPVGVVFANICSGIESGGDYIWINEIQISPDFRGLGIGKELLNHVLKWARRNDIKTVIGVAEADNHASRALFSSAGFVIDEINWMKKNISKE